MNSSIYYIKDGPKILRKLWVIQSEKLLIIVTDAHVSEAYANVDPFFEMLEVLSGQEEGVIFLGDIFELWVGMKRYEGAIHQRFLEWCRREKARRVIGFVEGNHEFYVTGKHRNCFTWSSTKGHFDPGTGTLFVHGDLINRADKNYLRFRKITKNPLTKALVAVIPRGPAFAKKLKSKLKTTNQDFRIGLPEEALMAFGRNRLKGAVRRIVVGHFHQSFHFRASEGRELTVLPDWLSRQTVGRLTDNGLEVMPWQALAKSV